MHRKIGSGLPELQRNRDWTKCSLHMDHYGHRLPLTCTSVGNGFLEFSIMTDAEGERSFSALDAGSSYGSSSLGFAHAQIKSAVADAVYCGNITDECDAAERTQMLEEFLGPGGYWSDQFRPGDYHASGRNSGSEGIELALAIVKESVTDPSDAGDRYRDKILTFEGAWHGWTAGAAALARQDIPSHFKTISIPFGDVAALNAVLNRFGTTLAAVFVEPIQGDAGILLPPDGFLRSLARRCHQHGILLVADEILTYARTGSFFAMRDENGPIPTDITVVGKNLGAGVTSTSMVIARCSLVPPPGKAVSTFDLRPFHCRVLRTVAQTMINESLFDHSAMLGKTLSVGLQDLVARFPQIYLETRGVGLLHGLELQPSISERAKELRLHLIEAGVYLELMVGAGTRTHGARTINRTLRISPPMVTSLDQVEEILTRLKAGSDTFQAKSMDTSKRSGHVD